MEPITGPGGRYRARLELLLEAGNDTYLRRQPSEARRQGAGWVVLFGEEATARLTLGEGGITLHALGLAKGGRAVLQAVVEAGPGAPAWLPDCTTLRLFEGDRQAAASFRERFIPLPGAAGPAELELEGDLPLDQLFIAVGRSFARANKLLAEIESPGGTALVTSVTVTVPLEGLAVERGRAVVKPVSGRNGSDPAVASTPARSWPSQNQPATPSSTSATAQAAGTDASATVEFTLTLAPGASPGPCDDTPSPSVSTGAPASSQSVVGLPMQRK